MNEFKLIEESSVIEHKRELPEDNKKWLKSVVSFSNGSGGKLIIGVEDVTLKVIGINEERSRIEQRIIETIYNGIDPRPIIDIVFKNIEDKDIVIVFVGKGNEVPYYIKSEGIENGTYVRFGSTNHLATQSQLYELKLNRINENFTNKIYVSNGNGKPVNSKEIEISALVEKLNKRSKTGYIINQNKLKEWKLLRDNFDNEYASNGLMLLLSNPFNYAYVRLGVFDGSDKSSIKKDYTFDGSIIDQFDSVLDKLLSELEDGYVINITRETRYKIPLIALREILANAIIHRNYFDEHPNRISVFNNRIEFYSPGALYDGMQLESLLNGVSRLRNPNISEVFYQIGLVEKWGSGISRANNSLRTENMKPLEIQIDLHGVNVIIYFEKNDTNKEIENNDKLDNENYLSYKQEFTRKDVENDLKYTQDMARDLIEKWIKDDLVTIIKLGPKTKYKIKN